MRDSIKHLGSCRGVKEVGGERKRRTSFRLLQFPKEHP